MERCIKVKLCEPNLFKLTNGFKEKFGKERFVSLASIKGLYKEDQVT
jgi:hypothetical protein